MRLQTLAIVLLAASLCVAASATSVGGWISTDRFGYTGTVVRYDTLADAQAGTNAVGTTVIGNRDLSLYVVDSAAVYDTDINVIMGSWWYTITGPSAGWGNTTGNSGVGFVQLYDEDGSTDTTVDMDFTNFDGTYWTEFSLLLQGGNADYPNDYTRFWVDYQGSGADMVVYHEYELALTASGLEGVQSGNVISSTNHPTNVSGTYRGIFENVSATYPQNNGFYVFDLALDMTNWAYDNRDDLVINEFAPSDFGVVLAPVPEPATMTVFGLGLMGFALRGWRKRRA